MKRPDATQIRTKLERRRLREAEAMARSDAIQDARILQAFDVLIDSRDLALADLEAGLRPSAARSAVRRRSPRGGSTH